MASLLMALQDHPTLKQLSIQQNSCHTEGMAAISSLLNYNDLEELDMSYLIRKKKTEVETVAPAEEPEVGSDEQTGQDSQEEEQDKEDSGSQSSDCYTDGEEEDIFDYESDSASAASDSEEEYYDSD